MSGRSVICSTCKHREVCPTTREEIPTCWEHDGSDTVTQLLRALDEKPDRLFVPLTAEAFEWWQSGKKRWEVRKDAPRWSEKNVYPGRRVELRRGYSGASLWGTIGAVHREALFDLSEHPDLEVCLIVPGAVWWREVLPAIGIRTPNWQAVWQRRAVSFEVVLDTTATEGEG